MESGLFNCLNCRRAFREAPKYLLVKRSGQPLTMEMMEMMKKHAGKPAFTLPMGDE
jgi:hypothetical protein